MNKRITTQEVEILNDIESDLFTMIDRNRYYSDPITPEALELIRLTLERLRDNLPTRVECAECDECLENGHVCELMSEDETAALEDERDKLCDEVDTLKAEVEEYRTKYLETLKEFSDFSREFK